MDRKQDEMIVKRKFSFWSYLRSTSDFMYKIRCWEHLQMLVKQIHDTVDKTC